MAQPHWRFHLCLLLIAVLPVSLDAQETGAMLHHTGGVLLNGAAAPLSSAIFPRAVVETPAETAASITLTGSRITINPDTEVDFEGDEVELEHGSVFVETSQSFRVRTGCILSTPAESVPTQYSVRYEDGRVTVSAFKKDVNIDTRSSKTEGPRAAGKSERVSVREGNQESREDKCAAGLFRTSMPGAKNAILNSAWARWSGVGAIGVLTCIALCRDDDPVSPSGFKN